MTLLSVLVALFVGGIEIASLANGQFQAKGVFWSLIDGINDNAGAVGFAVIVLFALTWGVSALVFRRTAVPVPASEPAPVTR